jgi:hypothetical protein
MVTGNPFSAPQTEPLVRDEMTADGLKKYHSIGGWLILVAIGLVVNVLVGALGAFGGLTIWATGDHTVSPVRLAIALAQTGGIGLVAATGLVLMFRLSRIFPRFMIFYLVLILFSAIANLGAAASRDQGTTALTGFARAMISCAIWIPYFIRSKRVKGTFTR